MILKELLNEGQKYPKEPTRLLRLTFSRFGSCSQLIKSLIWYAEISLNTHAKNRKYSDNYIQFAFLLIENNDSPHLQCVICAEVLAHTSKKPFLSSYRLAQLYVKISTKFRIQTPVHKRSFCLTFLLSCNLVKLSQKPTEIFFFFYK